METPRPTTQVLETPEPREPSDLDVLVKAWKVAAWLLVLGTVFLVALWTSLGRYRELRRTPKPFDGAYWKSSQPAGAVFRSHPERLRMLDDLLASGVLEGATRAEVEAYLGVPDYGIASTHRGGPNAWVWYLDDGVLDPYVFEVSFDRSDRVDSACVRTD